MTENVTILDHIGNPPLLKPGHVSDALGVGIIVKCEITNPGESIKDRMMLSMIEGKFRYNFREPLGALP